MKKLSLVLGSGGLRGMAHIGVLKVLEEAQIPIHRIVGCSIGSLIGALYASGYSARRLSRMTHHLQKREWLDLVVPRMGLFAGKKILTVMEVMTRQRKIEDTKIPLAIVATDLLTGTEVVWQTGSIAEAVRASTAVPGIFAPFAKDGKLYADGAIVNPIPVDVADRLGADVIVGVDLANDPSTVQVKNVVDVVLRSIDIVEQQIGQKHSEMADVMIYPAVGHISPSDFDSIAECIRLGEEATRRHIEEIRRLLAD